MIDNHSRRRILQTSVGFITIGIAGCTTGGDDEDGHHDDGGEEHDHGDAHELGESQSHVTVSMETHDDGSSHFGPHVVHVEPGGTVEWKLETGTHGTAAYHPETYGNHQRIPDGSDPWRSGQLESEETFGRTFDVEGVYDFVCRPHEADGMVGSVLVGWPDPDEQPGLKPPSDDRPDAAVEQLKQYNDLVRDVLENR